MNVNVLDKISYIHIDGHAHNIAQIVDIKSEKIASFPCVNIYNFVFDFYLLKF